MRKDLRERIGKEWLFCDGGTGSFLQARGLQGGELPELWNITHPEVIRELYESYLKAGCDIFNANTFGANLLKYPENLEEVVEAGVKLACEARDLCGREDAYIAIDIGPTGKLLEPMGDLSFDEAVRIFSATVNAGVKAGCDLVLIETMSDLYEAKAAVLAAKETCDLPVIATVTFDEKGRLLTGGNVDSAVAVLEGLGVTALGVNCGLGPDLMKPIVKRLTETASVPIVVNPNAGLPRTEDGKTVYDLGPEEFSKSVGELADFGVQVVGGCCGTTPEHIAEVRKVCLAKEFIPAVPKDICMVSSFSDAVIIDKKPLVVGERINPTGKKRFKEALRSNDIDYIISQGLEQEDAGADILDVNVGLPEIDEIAVMRKVVTKLQAVTALPLQIDTSDPKALEAGLRYYNGKAMINSVNGTRESIEAVMPLVAKYGGVLVALPLDESGIPDTANERVAIARKIYEAADEYGIPRKDIVIDGLCMAVSSKPEGANAALETVRLVTEELGGHTILGVSNISFGLPARPIINSNFLVMAMQCGLSLAIMNPNNSQMMSSYRAFLALRGFDENCSEYIENYANAEVGGITASKGAASSGTKGKESAGITLKEAIKKGFIDRSEEIMREEMKMRDTLEIINSELIPALDDVGKGFEAGTVFLPQLLMSADAAKAAFEIAKGSMTGQKGKTKGKVIVATVKGDIHDIGKNIVKVMLENYGYDVIDLGKDVLPETIADAAVELGVDVIGLSALMTTTVVNMEETIKILREKKPGAKVLVGGAVMTQEYADMIGADGYGKDAMATVRLCDEIFGVNK